jgi:flagellar hook-basal body complex protein FliE
MGAIVRRAPAPLKGEQSPKRRVLPIVTKAGLAYSALHRPHWRNAARRDALHTRTAMDPIRSLKPFDFAQAVARAGLGVDGQPLGVRKTAAAAPEGGFATAMAQALKSVSAQQIEAQHLQRELQLDNPAVSLEQTMVAMQKAQIGFQAAMTVRNQFVRAYTDIMNMTV